MPITVTVNTSKLDPSKLTNTTTEALVAKLLASIERMATALPIFAYKIKTVNWSIDTTSSGQVMRTFYEGGEVGFNGDYLAGLDEKTLDHLVYNDARKCLPPEKRKTILFLDELKTFNGANP